MSTLQLSDDQLVLKYINGDSQSFSTLFLRHKDAVYTYILNIVHDETLADDLFQETFIKVIVTLKQKHYSHDGKFLSWVIRIAHNLTIDHFRRIANTKTATDTNDISNDIRLSNFNDPDPIQKEQLIVAIEQLIQKLPEDQGRVLQMRIYQNLPFNRIAEIENISINTALGRMRYATLNLRRLATLHHLSPAI